MDLVSDSFPLGYWVSAPNSCESEYLSLDSLINVPRYIAPEVHDSRHSRLPLFFRMALPFLTPPDKFMTSGYRVEAHWRGKELKFGSFVTDLTGRDYSPYCTYHIPPTSVSIELLCCGVDQVFVEVAIGNKTHNFLFYKLPYLPVLVLHPAYVVDPVSTECNSLVSTKNTDSIYLNSDAYCMYDLLLLVYSWRRSMSPESTIEIDPISIYVSNIAEIDMSHIMFSQMCSTCLPSNPFSEMNLASYLQAVGIMVLPWACGTPVTTLLVGYMLIQLAGVFLPFIGAMFAFKPQSNYWVLVRPEFPNAANPLDFYLIHTDLIILAKCGDTECPLYIMYDSDFVPSADCIDVNLTNPEPEFQLFHFAWDLNLPGYECYIDNYDYDTGEYTEVCYETGCMGAGGNWAVNVVNVKLSDFPSQAALDSWASSNGLIAGPGLSLSIFSDPNFRGLYIGEGVTGNGETRYIIDPNTYAGCYVEFQYNQLRAQLYMASGSNYVTSSIRFVNTSQLIALGLGVQLLGVDFPSDPGYNPPYSPELLLE
jgi:hypothetical protein